MSLTQVIAESNGTNTPPQCVGNPEEVNFLAAPVVATANLPAAGAIMDGRILIEYTGSGLALVVYGHGLKKSVALT